MKKSEAVALVLAVNDGFTDELKRAFEGQFIGVEVQSTFDLFGAMCYVTSRVDDQPFTQEQANFIAAFEVGYMSARLRLANALGKLR